jgi:molybdopterin synthase sulfur carrier subunit
MVRVLLPAHLKALAGVVGALDLDVATPVTACSVVDALEARYPVLRGTIRDQQTKKRRPWVRFFACEQDLSHEPTDEPLPAPVAAGEELFVIVGAMAGG